MQSSILSRYLFNKDSRFFALFLTAYLRKTPSFMVIGAQRCGTTSLYSYLVQHPLILPSFKKEVHFFDHNYHRGTLWYKAFFPSIFQLIIKQKENGLASHRSMLTGEATPYYFFHPLAPKRIARILPNVKLIVLLRNPIDRAFSHYNHEVRMGTETLSFEEAIKHEKSRLQGEREKILTKANYRSYAYQHFSYLNRGIYISQVLYWLNFFPIDQLHVVCSEDFFEYPESVLKDITKFLGVPPFKLKRYRQYNQAKYKKMDSLLRKKLATYFKSYNEHLYTFLGRSYRWEDS